MSLFTCQSWTDFLARRGHPRELPEISALLRTITSTHNQPARLPGDDKPWRPDSLPALAESGPGDAGYGNPDVTADPWAEDDERYSRAAHEMGFGYEPDTAGRISREVRAAYEDDERLSPSAAYNETLHDLASEDIMRDRGETVMRADITPAEHTLVLAARTLADARQARNNAESAVNAVQHTLFSLQGQARTAQTAHCSANGTFEDALDTITRPVPALRPGMDCS